VFLLAHGHTHFFVLSVDASALQGQGYLLSLRKELLTPAFDPSTIQHALMNSKV
jgi:hypothetical protein